MVTGRILKDCIVDIFLKIKRFCPDSLENVSNDTEPRDDGKEHKVDDCTILIIGNPESKKSGRNEAIAKEDRQVSFVCLTM